MYARVDIYWVFFKLVIFFQKMHFFFRTFVTAFTYRKVYRQSSDFFGGSIKIWASRKYNKIANRTHGRSSFFRDFTLIVRNCRILASGPFALQPYYSRGRIVNSTLRVKTGAAASTVFKKRIRNINFLKCWCRITLILKFENVMLGCYREWANQTSKIFLKHQSTWFFFENSVFFWKCHFSSFLSFRMRKYSNGPYIS